MFSRSLSVLQWLVRRPKPNTSTPPAGGPTKQGASGPMRDGGRLTLVTGITVPTSSYCRRGSPLEEQDYRALRLRASRHIGRGVSGDVTGIPGLSGPQPARVDSGR